MSTYEGIFIFRPELAQQQQDDNLEKIKKAISAAGGKVEKQDAWGKKVLTFPIRKCCEGVYYFLSFNIKPTAILELKNAWKINEGILRFMITRAKENR